MSFNSTLYLCFLPAVLVLYQYLRPPARKTMLLAASWLFYAVYNPYFIWVILGTTSVDFLAGINIAKSDVPRKRMLWVLGSVSSNLGLLCFFKYSHFAADNLASAASLFGWHVPVWTVQVALPLGISFHTFQGISYTVDVYRREIEPLHSFKDFALFVSFFPQLVAGPIVRAPEFIPQIDCRSEASERQISGGLGLLFYGMVKKVYVADLMAPFVNDTFSAPSRASGLRLAFSTYAFAAQIYCDFSGYSDMAIGSAQLFGIRLPDNFRRPYLALSIRDFWQRWHMSLSRWLRDYLYVPLGGNRKGEFRTYVNLMITMLLGGLWHGAGWNWVVWGGIQGAVMSVERLTGLDRPPGRRLNRLLRWIVTFHVVCVSWIFFRSSSFSQAVLVLRRIFLWAPGTLGPDGRVVLYATAGVLLILLADSLRVKERLLEACQARPMIMRWAGYAAVLAFLLTFSRASHPEFIYFAF